MDRGLYIAASGGLLNLKQVDIVGNNLANASTVGFKAQRLVCRQQEFGDTLAGVVNQKDARAADDQKRTPGVTQVEAITDFSPGAINTTGDPLHAALQEPDHFFVVGADEGEAYTRAGNFTMNSEGFLTTPDGYPVMGEGGPITISQGSPKITSSGAVLVDGEQVGRLRVVKVDDLSKLERQEGVRFTLKSGEQPATVEAQVISGALEMPNISIVESMVEMISANRAFEGYTKVVRTIDELNERALRNARGM